ncbi:MAG: nucleoside hydrolase, partial [Chloroflexi bacterium]|nr:nucleoside hydrolase [Chloroflexota bacterium]
DITQAYMDFYLANEGRDACCLHDPLAVGAAVWPELVRDSLRGTVDVICDPGPTRGMTVIDRRRRGPWRSDACRAALERMAPADAATLRQAGLLAREANTTVALDVDADLFLRRFLERIS